MKQSNELCLDLGCRSLPPRERGLKHPYYARLVATTHVAPTTGAWIETLNMPALSKENLVAPTTGAWIETNGFHPHFHILIVAPTTGAWIETMQS